MDSLSTGDLTHNMAKEYLIDVEHLGYPGVPTMQQMSSQMIHWIFYTMSKNI